MNIKIDILESTSQKPCQDCGDPFGTIFAANGGICTTILCFQCITIYVNEEGFECE